MDEMQRELASVTQTNQTAGGRAKSWGGGGEREQKKNEGRRGSGRTFKEERTLALNIGKL